MDPATQPPKQVHTLILDTSPILLASPPLSTLLTTASTLLTTSSVLLELRADEPRQRFETLYRPFVTVRDPRRESVAHIRGFARRTGDLGVLSETDLEVLALAFECEVERNGGDWRLRSVPGQRRVNGRAPVKAEGEEVEVKGRDGEVEVKGHDGEVEEVVESLEGVSLEEQATQQDTAGIDGSHHMLESQDTNKDLEHTSASGLPQSTPDVHPLQESAHQDTEGSARQDTEDLAQPHLADSAGPDLADSANPVEPTLTDPGDSDSDGWITATNLKKKQAQDESGASTTAKTQQILQVATMTGDFAMQNVLLQMNLNLLSTTTCKRISHIRQTILRCHACFATTRDMSKQFCTRCGKPTLTRVSSSTNDKGEVKLHLKQNFQWNNRGNVYSVPKPQAGSANGKWKGKESGGGKNGWGNGLILAEDQKEYVRAVVGQGRKKKERDLMDEDFLPGILTGERAASKGGRVKVGAGRTVNSRVR